MIQSIDLIHVSLGFPVSFHLLRKSIRMITLDIIFGLLKLVMWAPPSKHCPTREVVLLQWVTGCAPLEKQLSRQWWTAHVTHNSATASSPVCEQPQRSHLGRISLLLDDACFIHGWLNLTVDKYGTEINKTSAFIILSGLAIVPMVGYGLRLWCYHHKSSYCTVDS